MHIVGAFLAIAIGNIAILVLGGLLTLPESMRRSMLMFSSLALVALLCFAAHRSFGIGRGTMERIAAYPVTIWLILVRLLHLAISNRRSRTNTPDGDYRFSPSVNYPGCLRLCRSRHRPGILSTQPCLILP